MNSNGPIDSLFTTYENYKENRLNAKLIRHSDVMNCIESQKNNRGFTSEVLGKSVDGRDISVIIFGTGKTDILAWSQMHGDEPTATAALFDLIKFFSADDSFNDFRKNILNKIRFHFIPMLNPDGAELFIRANAYQIDINRDAARLESNESKILWEYAEKIKPEFGFNLHDQNSYYTAGRTGKHSTISLLAPPSDHAKSISYTREKSMQVIASVYESLNNFIPGHIARYKDEHEPRSFGDNFIKKGISSILIESGYYKDDPEKEFVRKLNFAALLSAFQSIAGRDFENNDYTKYFTIPENQEMLFDLLLRNMSLMYKGKIFRTDIGINRKKGLVAGSTEFIFTGTIAEIGDLSLFSGIEEYDMTGFQISWTDNLAADKPADLKIEGKTTLIIKNGFFTEPEKIKSILN